MPESLRLAAELRRAGLRVEVYPEPEGQDWESSSSTPTRDRLAFVAVLGGDEIARGEVTIKNLKTGEQQSVPRASRGSVAQDSRVSRTPSPAPRTHRSIGHRMIMQIEPLGTLARTHTCGEL